MKLKLYILIKQFEYKILLSAYSSSTNKFEAAEFIQRKSKELQLLKDLKEK